MDEKTIEISVNLSSEDLKRVMFRQIRTKLVIFGGILFMFVAFIFLGVTVSLMSKKSNIPLPAFLPMLIPVLIFSFALLSLVWAVNKQAKQTGENAEETNFTFDDQGMESESASVSAKILWTKFYQVKESNTDFLIFTQKKIAVPIPKRFFTNEKQIVEFKNLLREKLGKKAKLKT